MEKVNGSTYEDVPPSPTEEEWENLFALVEANSMPVHQPFVNVLMIGQTAPYIATALAHVVIELHGKMFTVLKDKRSSIVGEQYHMDVLPYFLRLLEESYGTAEDSTENP